MNTQAQVRFADAAGGEYAAIQAPATIGANYVLTLPADDGNSGQYLQTDGSGNLSWVTPAGVGETNTASNVTGSTGVGLFKQKSTFDLQFKSLLPGSNKLTISGGASDVTLDVDDTKLNLGNIPNTATGNIVATDAQSAINELDTEKVAKAGDTMTGRLVMGPKGVAAGDGGSVAFTELAAGGTNVAVIRSPDALAADYSLTLPTSAGSSGQILSTDGTGILSWISSPAPGADSLDFTHFADAMTLDASTDIAATGTNVLSITNSGTGNSFVVNDQAADTTPFVISSTGLVGIGTTSPTSILHTLSGQEVTFDRVNFPTTGSHLLLRGGNGTVTAVTATALNDVLGTITFSGHNGTGFQTTGARITSVATENWSGTSKGAYLALETPPTGSPTSLERMRITDTGSVGIGTTVPGTILDAAGAITSRPYGTGTGNTGQLIMRELAANGTNTVTIRSPDANAADYVLTLPVDDGTSGQLLQTDGSGVLSWTNAPAPTADSLDFTHFADAMTLDASTDIAASGTNVLSVTNTGTGNSFVVNDQAADGSPFVIDASGNVGVGTATPATNLHLYSAGNTALTIDGPSGWNQSISFKEAGTEIWSIDNVGATDELTFWTGSGVAKMWLDQTGNLQLDNEMRLNDSDNNHYVGFVSPATVTADIIWTLPSADGTSGQLLQTNGSGVLSWTTPTATIADDSLNFDKFSDTMSLDASTDISAASNYFLSITNTGTGNSFLVNDQATDTTPFVIDPSGNVGIGTTTLSQKLTVNGRIETKGGLLFNQGSGSTDNLMYLSSTSAGSVDASLGFFAAGIGSTGATHGSYFLARGNDFSATAGQRGNIYFSAGEPSSGITSTENSINFLTGSDAQRMIINRFGYVGIGTTAPGTLLDVAGAITSRPYGTSTGNTGQLIMRELAAGGTETATIRAPDAITTSYALTLPTTAGSSGQVLTTDGTGILSWVSSLAPTADSLDFTHFADTMTLDASTDIAASGTNVLSITNSGSGNSFVVNDDVADTTPFVIDASGYVGIGTTTASSPLYVNGPDITATSSTSYTSQTNVRINPGSLSSNSHFATMSYANKIGANGSQKVAGAYGYVNNNGSGTITDAVGVEGYARNNGAGTITNAYGILATTDTANAGAIMTNAYAGYFDVNRTTSGTVTNGYGVYIADTDATNQYGLYQAGATDTNYFAGSVGIGTTSPTATLDVAGSVTYTATTGLGVRIAPRVSGDTTGFAGVSLTPRIIPNAALTNVYGNTALPQLNNSAFDITNFEGNVFRTDTTATYTGNITNANIIHVLSPSHSGSGTVSNVFGLKIDDLITGTNQYGIYQVGTNDINYLGGRLGLGTTTPASGFHLHNSAGAAAVIISTPGTGDFNSTMSLMTKSDGTTGLNVAGTKGWHWYARSDAYSTALEQNDLALNFYDGTTATNIMYVDSLTGNVGIGTTSPIAELHIYASGSTAMVNESRGNTATVSASNIFRRARDSAGSPSAVAADDVIGRFAAYGYKATGYGGTTQASIDFLADESFTDTATGTRIEFLTTPNTTTNNKVTAMTIDSTGFVGIGSTSPSQELEVVGQVKATSFIEGTESWSVSGGVTSMAAGGPGIVLITQTSGTNTLATITGCNSGTIAQNQKITLIIAAYSAGTLTFTDTAAGTATADSMILSGSTSLSVSAATQVGSTMTLLCTTIAGTKRWVEISRSTNTN